MSAVPLPVMSEIASLTQSARQSAIVRFQILQPHLEQGYPFAKSLLKQILHQSLNASLCRSMDL